MTLKQTLLPAIALTMLGAAATSCGNSAKTETDGRQAGETAAKDVIEFATYTDSVGYVVPDFIEGEPVYAAAKYSIVWPEKIGNQDFKALRDSLISLTFGATPATSFADATKDYLKSPLQNFYADMSGNLPDYQTVSYNEAISAAGNNEQTLSSEVTLLTPDLLVVKATNYVYYYHAAHGMTTVAYLNYSIKDHKVLDSANFFKPGNDTAILDLINHAAKEKYSEEGELFEDPIATYANFKVSGNDVVFVYQPYEVAPYSTGVVEVPVSQYDLYRFMTPAAQNALGLTD